MKSDIMKDMSGRIRECAKLVGSGDALARKAGMVRRTLETYFIGASEPSASKILAISEASGVSLEWLMRGEGPMMRDHLLAGDNGGEATSTLAHSAMAVYVTLFEAGKLIEPEKFEELTVAMWELDKQYGGNAEESPEDPIVQKVHKLLMAVLK